ncbi:MAG: AI-2E family transporter [Lentisphaeria bacterium]
MKLFNQAERWGGLLVLGLLLAGCFVVLRPFVSALLWSAILCFCTWPLFAWLKRRFPRQRNLPALLMTVLIALALVLPIVVVALSFAENLTTIINWAQATARAGIPPPPEWVAGLPVVGGELDAAWRDWAVGGDRLEAILGFVTAPVRDWLLHRGMALGRSAAVMILSVFIAFFFFRDGELVVEKVAAGASRLLGDRTQRLLTVVGQTVRGVVYGILGTALAQGALAAFGFWLAGVPAPLLWGLGTFFISFIPSGPPLIWIPATAWLFYTGHAGWGVFLAVWGFCVISGVDNVIRPYLISRGGDLPFILVLLGVLGGVLAFGFIGMFLGPVLLAMGYALVTEWTIRPGGPAKGGGKPAVGPAVSNP